MKISIWYKVWTAISVLVGLFFTGLMGYALWLGVMWLRDNT